MATSILDALRSRVVLLGAFVGSIWVVSVLGFVFSLQYVLGVAPRSIGGLVGVVTAPWVHAGFGHLLSNTLPLLVLGWLAMVPSKAGFWQGLLGGLLGAGICAWLLGAPHSMHIGASGLVFGFFGFVLGRGFYTRRMMDIAVAVPAAALYGVSMLLGVLPVYTGVSWQSHLGGAIGGVLAARIFCSKRI